jgi:uncharacterized protein (DUF2461 family)
MYQMGPDELDRYRRAVADERSGARLLQIVRALEAQKIQVTGHDSLKTVPRGYPKDHPRADLLRNKGLVTWKDWPAGAWLGRASAKTRVIEFLRASRPLMGWLSQHIGSDHS